MDMFTESVKKGCHHNHGYNYVNSWWICKILSMQNINILLFVRSLSLANLSSAVKQGGPVVRFPPGHYRQCNWPGESVYRHVFVQIVDILNTFCEQTCKQFAFFMCCWFKRLLSTVSDFLCRCLMVDRPTLLNSEWTKSKMLIFCIVLVFALLFMTLKRYLLVRW